MRYRVIKCDRKMLGLEVSTDGVVIRAPYEATRRQIRKFVKENKKWIHQQKKEFPKRVKGKHLSEKDINNLVERAKVVIPPRVEHYAALIGVRYNRITIRHQKTRWGSCSGKCNLNFNCLLLLTPTEVMDSVIIHELCHLKYMNHSKEFYNEVLRVCPDYKTHNLWLKKNGPGIIRRMTEK